MNLLETNNALEVAAKNRAEALFNERIERSEGTSIHGLKTLKAIFATASSNFDFYICHQLKARRKTLLFKDMIKPVFDKYQDELLAIELAKGDEKQKLKKNLRTDPIQVISYIIAEQLTNNVLGYAKPLTNMARHILNKMFFALDISEVETDNVIYLKDMINITRNIIETSEITYLFQEGTQWMVDYEEPYKTALNELNKGLASTQIQCIPMVVPPRRHKNLISTTGGYNVMRSPLLKNPVKVDKAIPDEILDFNSDKFPAFYKTLNNIQETGYKVDTWLLDKLNSLKEMGITAPNFEWDTEVAHETAHKTADSIIATMEERYKSKDWILSDKKKKEIHEKNVASETAKHYLCRTILEQANQYKQFDAIYYPMFADRRGRIYPYMTSGLSFQGNSLAKALLSFTQTQIVNKHGRQALWATLGSCLGGDKMVVAKRIEFAKSMKKEIWAMMESNDLTFIHTALKLEADEFTLALKFAKEVYNAETIKNYATGAVVHLDACSSAIQLTGLLQHCKQCAVGTNLVNSTGDTITDAYKQVSDTALRNLLSNDLHASVSKWVAGNDIDYQAVKSEILANKEKVFSRKTVKKSVMVCLSYGGSMLTSFDDIREQLGDADVTLSDDAEAFVLRHLYYSLEQGYPAPVLYQKWAQKVAAAIIKKDGIFKFRSPQSNFPVFLENKVTNEVQLKYYDIQTRKQRSAVLREVTQEVNKRKTATGAVPGIIHSIDAGLLLKTARKLDGPFSPIHDSFGTLPNLAWKEMLPLVNYNMYTLSKMDVLNNIVLEAGLELEEFVPPHQGSLDVSLVLKAEHAFT